MKFCQDCHHLPTAILSLVRAAVLTVEGVMGTSLCKGPCIWPLARLRGLCQSALGPHVPALSPLCGSVLATAQPACHHLRGLGMDLGERSCKAHRFHHPMASTAICLHTPLKQRLHKLDKGKVPVYADDTFANSQTQTQRCLLQSNSVLDFIKLSSIVYLL